MAAALDRLLPPKLRENADIYKRTQDALTEAKISSIAELLSMTRDQIKAANVPVAARPYLCVKREEPPSSISTAPPSPAVDVTTEISLVSDLLKSDTLPFCGDGLHGLVNAGDVAAIKELHASLPAAVCASFLKLSNKLKYQRELNMPSSVLNTRQLAEVGASTVRHE